jgi:exodeoxyribonuclease V gamma subunit
MKQLAANFCVNNSNKTDPFETTTVITQSTGIGQWLKFQLAEQHGIASNINCILPATFLWRLYQTLIPETQNLRLSPFDPERLTWRIMRILPIHPRLSGAISNYLSGAGDADLRLYQLCREIALLYDKYLMYRPDWIIEWRNGSDVEAEQGHAAWQANLWRLLLEDVPEFQALHRAALHQQVVSRLSTSRPETDIVLPWRRISIFGLSTIPPLQLQTFELLANHIDVDIYFMNPCSEYWGDIVSGKEAARRSIRQLIDREGSLVDEDYLEVGNPLLSSLGKQGREFLEQLLESHNTIPLDDFIHDVRGTALARVRNDILDMTFGGAFLGSEQPESVPLNDNSIQLHSCHSKLREVEVLHDEILRQFDDQPDLQTSDIVVMVPDIADYGPYIHAVFSNSLPYRLSDRNPFESSTLLTSFLWLLHLPESRLPASDVLDFIEVPAVMRRFEITDDELETIRAWVEKAAIRWEISGEDKASNWQVPPDHQNTWKFGLSRLILGFAQSGDRQPWQGILPVDLQTSETALLGRLNYLVSQLSLFRNHMKQARAVSEWQTVMAEMLETFYLPSGDDGIDQTALLQQIDELAVNASLANHDAELSYQALSHILQEQMTRIESRGGFVSGGITFATLVPMRSIPFRMVCLLGMNDGEYPRDIHAHSFDLMANSTARRGDRSRKLDDRYLFLEALLSAEDIFYVSYEGRGARDNKPKPPSAILGEYIDYLNAIYQDLQVVQHPLQPFTPACYTDEKRTSYNRIWYEALTASSEPVEFADVPLPPDESSACESVHQLVQFVRHPAKYFLNQRLEVFLDRQEEDIRETENFSLDALQQYNITDEALEVLLNGDDLDGFREKKLASGLILSGDTGRLQLERTIDRARNIFQVADAYTRQPPRRVEETLSVGDRSLYFSAGHLFEDNLVTVRAGSNNASQLITAWVNHLAINLIESDISSVLIGRGDKDKTDLVTLEPVTIPEAEEHLSYLLALYDAGIRAPIFMPPGASQRYYEESIKKDERTALASVISYWYSDYNREGQDRYWRRLFEFPQAFNDDFLMRAHTIWQSISEARADD